MAFFFMCCLFSVRRGSATQYLIFGRMFFLAYSVFLPERLLEFLRTDSSKALPSCSGSFREQDASKLFWGRFEMKVVQRGYGPALGERSVLWMMSPFLFTLVLGANAWEITYDDAKGWRGADYHIYYHSRDYQTLRITADTGVVWDFSHVVCHDTQYISWRDLEEHETDLFGEQCVITDNPFGHIDLLSYSKGVEFSAVYQLDEKALSVQGLIMRRDGQIESSTSCSGLGQDTLFHFPIQHGHQYQSKLKFDDSTWYFSEYSWLRRSVSGAGLLKLPTGEDLQALGVRVLGASLFGQGPPKSALWTQQYWLITREYGITAIADVKIDNSTNDTVYFQDGSDRWFWDDDSGIAFRLILLMPETARTGALLPDKDGLLPIPEGRLTNIKSNQRRQAYNLLGRTVGVSQVVLADQVNLGHFYDQLAIVFGGF